MPFMRLKLHLHPKTKSGKQIIFYVVKQCKRLYHTTSHENAKQIIPRVLHNICMEFHIKYSFEQMAHYYRTEVETWWLHIGHAFLMWFKLNILEE